MKIISDSPAADQLRIANCGLKPKAGCGGFSLIEILVITAIIALLLGISIPSITAIQRSSRGTVSQIRIDMLTGGVEMYAADFNAELPPSDNSGLNLSQGFEGGQLLVLYMTGYPNDLGDGSSTSDGEPCSGSSNDFDEDDGKQGFGFRTQKRSRVYGPYNGAENIPTDGSTPPYFVDAFDNQILYYKYDSPSPHFRLVDNNGASSYPNNQAILDGANDYRTDFLIISPGWDQTYDASFNAPGGNDLSNATK